MTVLTDELLRRRLGDRVASGPEVSLTAIASSVTARRQRRVVGPVGRWSIVGSAAAAVVVGVVLVGGLMGRTTPPTSVLGSASTSPGYASEGSSETAAESNVPVPPSPTPSSSSAPITGCDTLGFDARRCNAIVARARERTDPPLRAEDVIAATVTRPMPDSTSLGSFPMAAVTFELLAGGTTTVEIRCGLPGPSDRVCSADPQIGVQGDVSHDVPCGPTPGGENHPCATLPPSPRPAVIAASEPLVLRVVDVPLHHVGHYDVLVGSASLPDGLLSQRSGEIGDPRPTAYWIDSGVSIVVRPGKACTGDACPSIESIYHAPFHGPQPVNVYLVFDVVDLTVPGTVLEIRNLVVR
jgi:hypothetical protein